MSTRCNVVFKDDFCKLYFYRHCDGYPEGAGKDLKEFVDGYTTGKMRLDSMQSAGWLILRGHEEYKDDKDMPWKVGAYEPTHALHADIDYMYVIDLKKRTLICRDAYDKKLIFTHKF